MPASAVASQRWRWLEFFQRSTFAQRSSTSACTAFEAVRRFQQAAQHPVHAEPMQRHGLLEKLFVSDLASRFDSISLVNSRHLRGNGIHPDVEKGQPCVILDVLIRIGDKKEVRYGFFCQHKRAQRLF